eukprot:3523254-Heterocapsa_arctica.AAC.1
MDTLMTIISEEATAILYNKPSLTKKKDCEDEIVDIIASRHLALIQRDTEEVERITKLLKTKI